MDWIGLINLSMQNALIELNTLIGGKTERLIEW